MENSSAATPSQESAFAPVALPANSAAFRPSHPFSRHVRPVNKPLAQVSLEILPIAPNYKITLSLHPESIDVYC